MALAVGTYAYGIPLASRLILAAVPMRVDEAIGDVFFESMHGSVLRPSRLAPSEQSRLRAAFNRALARAEGESPLSTLLEFRSGDIGPNAFALPGRPHRRHG